MGKKIVWSPTSLRHLEEVHSDIFETSKSLTAADRVVNDITSSVSVLSEHPEIYTLDENKIINDGTYRSFQVRTYSIAYRILEDVIRIIRVRYSGKEPREY